jgi:hypothetical protein
MVPPSRNGPYNQILAVKVVVPTGSAKVKPPKHEAAAIIVFYAHQPVHRRFLFFFAPLRPLTVVLSSAFSFCQLFSAEVRDHPLFLSVRGIFRDLSRSVEPKLHDRLHRRIRRRSSFSLRFRIRTRTFTTLFPLAVQGTLSGCVSQCRSDPPLFPYASRPKARPLSLKVVALFVEGGFIKKHSFVFSRLNEAGCWDPRLAPKTSW